MRQVYKFQESKLDELHEQVVYFFEVIYFQSLQGEIPWSQQLIVLILEVFAMLPF